MTTKAVGIELTTEVLLVVSRWRREPGVQGAMSRIRDQMRRLRAVTSPEHTELRERLAAVALRSLHRALTKRGAPTRERNDVKAMALLWDEVADATTAREAA